MNAWNISPTGERELMDSIRFIDTKMRAIKHELKKRNPDRGYIAEKLAKAHDELGHARMSIRK